MEMSADEAAKKMLSAQSAIRLEKLERGFIEDQEDIERLEEGIRALEALPIYLDDPPRPLFDRGHDKVQEA